MWHMSNINICHHNPLDKRGFLLDWTIQAADSEHSTTNKQQWGSLWSSLFSLLSSWLSCEYHYHNLIFSNLPIFLFYFIRLDVNLAILNPWRGPVLKQKKNSVMLTMMPLAKRDLWFFIEKYSGKKYGTSRDSLNYFG